MARANDLGWAWRPKSKPVPAARGRRRRGKRNRRDPFYQSEEWLRLRYKALKLHGARCQCCGAVGARMHVDHIKPRSRYPELALDIRNVQVLCARCNYGKGAWDETDWRGELTPEQQAHMAEMAVE